MIVYLNLFKEDSLLHSEELKLQTIDDLKGFLNLYGILRSDKMVFKDTPYQIQEFSFEKNVIKVNLHEYIPDAPTI